MSNKNCPSLFKLSPTRKRPSSDAEDTEHVNKRAKSTIDGMYDDYHVISTFISRWDTDTKKLDEALEKYAKSASLVLSKKWVEDEDPEDQLEHMKGVRRRFERISERFSIALRILEDVFSSTHAINDIFDRFVRTGLRTDFWCDRAVEFRRRITIPEYPRRLITLLEELWVMHEDYAEHFCRLSPRIQRKFLRYLRMRTKSCTVEDAYDVVEDASASKIFRHCTGYDTRSASEWFEEEFVFQEWGSSPATDDGQSEA